MQGLITESHFAAAERFFPGIRRFYCALSRKPATFLELVWKYEHRVVRLTERVQPDRGHPGRRPDQ